MRSAAVDLTAELCHRLPVPVLNEYLTALVLGLYSILENVQNDNAGTRNIVRSIYSSACSCPCLCPYDFFDHILIILIVIYISTPIISVTLNILMTSCATLKCLCTDDCVSVEDLSGMGNIPVTLYPPAVPHADSLFYSPHTHGSKHQHLQQQQKQQHQQQHTLPSPLSDELSHVCGVLFARKIDERYRQKTRTAAINIIRNLFLKRIKDVEFSVRYIPCIPNIPELKSVQMVHTQKLEEMSLDQNLRILCASLLHESSFVKRIVLQKIHSVLCLNRTYVCIAMGGDVSTAGGVYVLNTGSAVCVLLLELLQLCSKEADTIAIDWCARCLGELRLCCAVLCCAVLCCAVLCCAVVCCAVLWCGVLWCAVLCCAVLWCAVLWCAVLCCVVLCYAMLCHTILCCSFYLHLIQRTQY